MANRYSQDDGFTPPGKFSVWSQPIWTILKNSSSCQQWDLAKVVGQLDHTCFIIPHAHHFIGHIRHFTDTLSIPRKHVTILSPIIADLKLWIQFLNMLPVASTSIILSFASPVFISIRTLVSLASEAIVFRVAMLGVGNFGGI